MKQFPLKSTLTAALVLAISLTFSCSGGDDGSCSINGGTVKIGSQTWMSENLNCNVSGSVCYGNDPANCTKYGRLYDWNTANKVCPSGWRLPSNNDWGKLVSYVESENGCSGCAGKYLKAKNGWDGDGNGEDTYGFSALPGGYGYSVGGFGSIGLSGFWWSASSDSDDDAYYRRMIYDGESAYWYGYSKDCQFSVRCVQD